MLNYNTQLQSNNTDLQTVLQTLQTKAAGGTQTTPVISVSSNGLITATAGTKSSTHQLAFQPAKTITPNTSSQIAVSSGYYTGGDITVAGDSNLVAENIKSGVSIFGVNGTLTGGGGSADIEDGLISRALTSYTNDRATNIGSYAFYLYTSLTAVNFPAVTTINDSAFCRCYSLTTISFPAAISIGSGAFNGCDRLTTVSFPVATSIINGAFIDCSRLTAISFPAATHIGYYAFGHCYSLTTVSFPAATSIGSNAFLECDRLTSFYITNSKLCALLNSNAFSYTPIGGYSASTGIYGSIYVPASLLTSYKKATNWICFSNRFCCLEDFYIEPIEPKQVVINATTNMSINMVIRNDVSTPVVTFNSDNNSMVSISNVTISDGAIFFDVVSYGIEGETAIIVNATNGNYSQSETFNISVLEELPFSYAVESVEGSYYGFSLKSNGYYESQNKGEKDSYALCKVKFYVPTNSTIYVDCINYAENNYDYGLLSNLDTTLELNYNADSKNVYYNFKGKSAESIQTVTYNNVPVGNHYLYIKFIKDYTGNSGNDTLQFKIRYESLD